MKKVVTRTTRDIVSLIALLMLSCVYTDVELEGLSGDSPVESSYHQVVLAKLKGDPNGYVMVMAQCNKWPVVKKGMN